MAASIGIKIANGEFYPILEEGKLSKKRLVLTTVHDNQRSVQIDLYKSESRTMADADYIGSLVIENLAPKPKGEPSIEMIISFEEDESIVAEAIDLDAPAGSEPHQLSVSLRALSEHETYDLPDFELDQPSHPPQGLYERARQYETTSTRESPSREETREDTQRASFPLIPVLLGLLALLVLGALVVVVFLKEPSPTKIATPLTTQEQSGSSSPTGSDRTPAPTEHTPPRTGATDNTKAEPIIITEPAPPTTQSPAATATDTPSPEKRAASPRRRPPAPVSTYKVPTTIPKEGVSYKIRWGDTLWDIAEAFYRNPWLYPRIARFNKIKNPDLIISGTTIKIPPKN